MHPATLSRRNRLASAGGRTAIRLAAVAGARGGPLARCALALLLALSVLFAFEARAASPWRVVILPGTDPAQPAVMLQDQAFRSALEGVAPNGVEYFTDALDGLRFGGDELMPEFLALLAKKYRRQHIDLIVGLSGFALEFIRKHHEQLWPGTPVLILSVEEDGLRERGIPADFSYLPFRLDIDGTLAIAEALQPTARRLVVVAGVTQIDRTWANRAVEVARARTTRRWTPETWFGLPLPELRTRLAALDLNTAVLYTTMYRDREDRSYFPLEVVQPMAEVSGAPIYGLFSTYLPQGLTAGSLVDFERSGVHAAELAGAILLGQTDVAGASREPSAPRCMAHVGRLLALGLDAGALPDGCELAYRQTSIWQDHRREAIAGLVVFVLQALTITGLLVQRRRRRLAEDEAAQRRSELTRAARVASVGELSASIAHEVGQPIGAILSNADAVEIMLRGAAPDMAELAEIVTDVRRDALRASEVVRRLRALLEKQAIEFVPLDLQATFDEALALLEPEARRRGVAIERGPALQGARCVGDRIQLQQVLLNLAINAMDAMQDTAPARRQLSLALLAAEGGFELRVADRGHGISAEAAPRLFESFFTTKTRGIGLGLSIVRTVVEAHAGQVSAASREGGGSVFTVWLPAAGGVSTSDAAAPRGTAAARTGDTTLRPTAARRS